MEWPGWAASLWETVGPYLTPFAVWRGYEPQLQTLMIFGAGVALYTALVFLFYQNISRRSGFVGDRKPGLVGWLKWLAGKTLIFPAMSFLYFSVIAGSLFLLTKAPDAALSEADRQAFILATTAQTLLFSMAVVVAVRMTVVFSEAMSNDLAKLVPLSLLAVVLVDPGYLSLAATWERLQAAVAMTDVLARYFLLFIVLDLALVLVRAGFLRARDRLTGVRGDRPLRKKDLLKAAARHEEPSVRVAVKEPAAPASATAREGPAATEFEVLK